MENNKPRIAKIILNKRTAGDSTIHDLKVYYRALPIWDWHKNKEFDQWNQIEDQYINIFYKEGGKVKWKKKRQCLQQMALVKLHYCCMLRNLNICIVITLYNTQVQLAPSFNIKQDPLTLIEERVGNSLEFIWHRRRLYKQNS